MGLLTGLGAASADAIYGAIAAFGLTTVSNLLVDHRKLLGLVGGVFLCYLGVRTFFARTPEQAQTPPPGGGLMAYGSTFVLTLTNPMTILSFVAVFAGLGVGRTGNYIAAAVLVGGVFIGSACWWLLLSGGVGLVRARLTPGWMKWVNRTSGLVITSLGVYALASAVRG
jgi:threonine/homoserine/homoserine lactone efflux protein